MVIFQIFGHLHPSDLLALIRVNKAFRAMLLSRGSSFLWNRCLRFCDIPTTPADMSPPAWAHLLFGGAYCYVSNSLFSGLYIAKHRLRGSELWRKAGQQGYIFSAPTGLQVLQDNTVSGQHHPRAVLAL
jgi:hypothetical protein